MILLITAKRLTGLQYHRQIVPFRRLGLEYEIQETTEGLDDEYLKRFSIISFLREADDIQKYKKLGLRVHMDIDDYWVLPSSHTLCKHYKATKYAERTIETLKQCDFITTTTGYLANRINQFNDNVYILPNAIDTEEEQWQPNERPNIINRVRFGYVAGSHHVRDVEMIRYELLKLWNDREIKDKWQLLTAGFNFNKYPKDIKVEGPYIVDEEGNKIVANPYYRYVEQCFTENYRYLNDEYRQILAGPHPIESTDVNEPYQRLNGKDVSNYGKLYDSIDVALVPLTSTEFNRCKSQLKIIEAGFKKKACITSDVTPYIEEWNSDNIFTCKDNEWYKTIKTLIKYPDEIEYRKEAMYDYVKVKYHIDTVNIERKQIFELWLNK